MAKPLLDLFPVSPRIAAAQAALAQAKARQNEVVQEVQASCPHDAVGYHQGRSDSFGWQSGRFVCLSCGLHEDRDWRSERFSIADDDCVRIDWDTMIRRTIRADG